jgi:hypothetical protein
MPPPSVDGAGGSRVARRAATVGWASFLLAGVLEMLVFSLVDPTHLRWFGSEPVELSATAVYTIAFFAFWAVIAVACGLTLLLDATADELNADAGGPGRAPGHSGPRWPA